MAYGDDRFMGMYKCRVCMGPGEGRLEYKKNVGMLVENFEIDS